ncbi:MAG: bifunctional folylpolyglutamate synthase/dihydrofolate synthase, partial [Bacteroidota bacterium]
VRQLNKLEHDKLHIVFGGVNDKPWDDLLPLLPKDANYILCQPNIPRAIAAADLAQHFAKHELNYTIKEDVNEAIAVAKSQASEKDAIFIGGSTFVVAEINDL